MLWTNILIDVLLVVYVIDCLFMGLVILMQRSKQEGLGAAFGGGMMSDTFGAQTSQVLVKATVWAAILFFILSISLARLYSARATMMEKGSPLQQELLKPLTPVPPVTPISSAAQPMVMPMSPTNAMPSAVAPIAPASVKAPASPTTSPAQPAGK